MPYFYTDDSAFNPGLRVVIVGSSDLAFVKQCSWCWRRMFRNRPADAMRRNWRTCSHACEIALRNCLSSPNLGRKIPAQQVARMAAKVRGVPRPQMRLIIGERHWNWQGGKTRAAIRARNNAQYREWRIAVFERDNYTCQECGARNGNGKKIILNADHKKPFAYFPELRYEVSNGQTLCLDCHRKTPTFSWRAKAYALK